MIYRISIILYRYNYCIEKIYRYPALGSGVMEWKPALQGTYGPSMNAVWWVAVEKTFENREYKTLTQCDMNVDPDGQCDYNSFPCT